MPNAQLAVVAGNYKHVGHEAKYMVAGLQRLFATAPRGLIRAVCTSRGNYHDYGVETMWKSVMKGYSTDYEDGAALLGNEFTRAVIGEGSHVPKHVFDKKLLRAIDGATMNGGDRRGSGKLSIYTTPKEFEGCSAAEWERVMKQTKKRPEMYHCRNVPFANSVWIRESNILENPHYSRKVYEHRKATMDKVAFGEQYGGLMQYATGRVLRSFDDARHVTEGALDPDYIRRCRLAVGIDTGAYTGMVLAAIGPDSKLHVMAETYTEQRTIWHTLDEFGDVLVQTLRPAFQTDSLDLIRPHIDTWVIDPASQHKAEIMEYWPVVVSTPAATIGGKLELIPSLEEMDKWFLEDSLFVNDDCPMLLDMIRKYVWKTVKAGGGRAAASAPVVKEPRKDYDHLIDAARFAAVTLVADGPRLEPPKVATFAQQWESEQIKIAGGPVKDWLEKARRQGGIQC